MALTWPCQLAEAFRAFEGSGARSASLWGSVRHDGILAPERRGVAQGGTEIR